MQTTDLSQITNNTSFSHLTVAFPISRRLGASIGMLPYSNIGYELSSIVVDDLNPDHLGVANYSGDGGLSKIYFGCAYEPFHGFSPGSSISNSMFIDGFSIRQPDQIFFLDPLKNTVVIS